MYRISTISAFFLTSISLLAFVIGQDVTNFDVYSFNGVPWKTRNNHNFDGIKVYEISSLGKDTDKELKNYRSKYRTRNNFKIDDDYNQNSDYYRRRKNDRNDRRLFTTTNQYYSSDELGSEFGKIVTPIDRLQHIDDKFKYYEKINTQDSINRKSIKNGTIHEESIASHAQKNSNDQVKNKNINHLLKRYLNELYIRKYERPRNVEMDPSDIDRDKSKFLENGLETLALIKNKTKKFANKFLNVFQVVKFNNTACQGALNGLQYQGMCYLATECASLNGMAGGSCADGFGVCCIFRGSCGGSGSQNCSYFESPNYPDYYPQNGGGIPPIPTAIPTPIPTSIPTPTPTMMPDLRPDPRLPMLPRQFESLECTFKVTKTSPDIQQMRIDFLDLELLGPTNGTCINERLVITGNGINNQIPSICGYNTGQHVYVDVTTLNGPLMLSVLSNMSYRKRFRLRICQFSQMACTSSNNCLQYYTGTSGMISSFNYDQQAIMSRSSPSYFNNLNYAICIRREAGYCSITYTNTMNGMEYPFQLVNFAAGGQSTVMNGQAGIESFNCPNDYIVINGIRLCGYKLNDGTINSDLTKNVPVTDNSLGPIVVQVRSNGALVGRGFKLFYTQNRCQNSF